LLFEIGDFRIAVNEQIATEWGYFGVYRDSTYYQDKPVFIRSVALQIK